MGFTEFKVDGDCVVDAEGTIVYDDLSPRAAGIIAELLTWRSIAEAEGEWRPIETAPKDGSFILLYLSGEGHHGPRLHNVAIGAWVRTGRWYTHCDGAGGVVSAEPTHWKPLPEPPSA